MKNSRGLIIFFFSCVTLLFGCKLDTSNKNGESISQIVPTNCGVYYLTKGKSGVASTLWFFSKATNINTSHSIYSYPCRIKAIGNDTIDVDCYLNKNKNKLSLELGCKHININNINVRKHFKFSELTVNSFKLRNDSVIFFYETKQIHLVPIEDLMFVGVKINIVEITNDSVSFRGIAFEKVSQQINFVNRVKSQYLK